MHQKWSADAEKAARVEIDLERKDIGMKSVRLDESQKRKMGEWYKGPTNERDVFW